MNYLSDILFSILFLMLTFNLKNLFRFTVEEKKLADIIFLFHTIVCFAATPVLFYGGDAKGYWMAPKRMSFEYVWNLVVDITRPTEIMYLINYFFTNTLNLSFIPGMLLYSMLGMLAFLFILQSVKAFIPKLESLKTTKLYGIPIFPYIFLLPNMHFWSVGIGKDTLLFLSVSLFVYAILNIKKRYLAMISSVIIAYFIRPHILLFLVSGYALGYLLSQRFPLYQKVFFSAIMLAFFLPLLNTVLDFAKIDQFSTEHIESFTSSKAQALSVAGSGVDLSSYPYPLKVLTFLFRPLFFDVNGIPAVIASVENLIQIFLLIFFFKNRGLYFIIRSHYIIRGSFFYYLIGAFAFAPIMSNLGIIIREKNMMMPAFLIFILGSIQFKRLYSKNGK